MRTTLIQIKLFVFKTAVEAALDRLEAAVEIALDGVAVIEAPLDEVEAVVEVALI